MTTPLARSSSSRHPSRVLFRVIAAVGIVVMTMNAAGAPADAGASSPSPATSPAPSWDVGDAEPSRELTLGKPYGFRDLGKGIGADQAAFWTYPFRGGTKRHLKVALPVLGGLGVLFAVDDDVRTRIDDSPSESQVRTSGDVSDTLDAAFSYGLPIALWSIGRSTHRPRLAETGGLMTRALLSSGVKNQVLKSLAGLIRPKDENGGDFTGPRGGLLNELPSRADSFPSGHTETSFAVATVLAGRTQRRWVKWAAFGTAGLIAATRITSGNHFPSDVLAAATLGWARGRLTLRNHRKTLERARLERLNAR